MKGIGYRCDECQAQTVVADTQAAAPPVGWFEVTTRGSDGRRQREWFCSRQCGSTCERQS